VWGNCPGLYAYHPTSSVELTCCVADSSASGGAGTIIYGENTVFSDPLFCDAMPCAGRAAGATDYHVLVSSPALPENNPCGVLIGALGSCEATSVPTSPTLPDDAIWASPNPFSSTTALSLTTAPDHDATLAVFDIAGRQVRRLRLSGSASPVTWDGTDENGGQVAPGTYLLMIDGRRSAAGRVTIVR